MEKKNIFVVGIDEFNYDKLRSIENAHRYRFHELLELPKVKQEDLPLVDLLDRAEAHLQAFEGSIDAVIGFWDFPVSLMAPYLADRQGLPGPGIESVIRAEHKYFSREAANSAAPEHNPAFDLVHPRKPEEPGALKVNFPFWLKPVVAYGGQLAFRVEDEESYRQALEEIRKELDRFAGPYNEFLGRICTDQEVCAVGGEWCIAEGVIGGWQCTLSGFMHDGEMHTYGVVDSINYPDSSSFFRYQYPSRLSEAVQDRMVEIARKVIQSMDFDQSPFNMEFYYDEEDDQIWMLELNTRISQSHTYLYQQVDGVSNHQVLVEAALGVAPHMPRNKGDYAVAAKFHPRVFEDRQVVRAPSQEDLERLQEKHPDVEFLPEAEEGRRLSEMPNQDPYSYRLARVYIAADSQEELLDKFQRVMDEAGYEFDE
jgi:hypothetical protein